MLFLLHFNTALLITFNKYVSMRTLKYALIGCGRIATNHIRAVLDNGLELVAVCDIVADRMDELLEKHGLQDAGTAKYSDYKKMISERELDLVAVATESGKHAEIALFCIDKRINVIIEKPMSMSIEDADRIIRLAKEKDVKVSVCHQNRFNIAVRETRKALEENRFGKLSHGTVHVRWNRNKSYYDQAKWRGTLAQDGGVLMNQCIHGIDLLRWLLGDEITKVYAITRKQFHDYLQCEDVGVAVVEFKNGAIATIEGTTNVFPINLEETLYIFGEAGTVKLGGKSANAIEIWQFKDSRQSDDRNNGFFEKTQNVYGNGLSLLYTDVIEAIGNGRDPYVDGEAGKRALELVLAIYKSAYEQKPVELPLECCSIMDFLEETDEE